MIVETFMYDLFVGLSIYLLCIYLLIYFLFIYLLFLCGLKSNRERVGASLSSIPQISQSDSETMMSLRTIRGPQVSISLQLATRL